MTPWSRLPIFGRGLDRVVDEDRRRPLACRGQPNASGELCEGGRCDCDVVVIADQVVEIGVSYALRRNTEVDGVDVVRGDVRDVRPDLGLSQRSIGARILTRRDCRDRPLRKRIGGVELRRQLQ